MKTIEFKFQEGAHIDCLISTPQFKRDGSYKMFNQSGKFFVDTLQFIPDDIVPGGHSVQFSSLENFENSRIDNKTNREIFMISEFNKKTYNIDRDKDKTQTNYTLLNWIRTKWLKALTTFRTNDSTKILVEHDEFVYNNKNNK